MFGYCWFKGILWTWSVLGSHYIKNSAAENSPGIGSVLVQCPWPPKLESWSPTLQLAWRPAGLLYARLTRFFLPREIRQDKFPYQCHSAILKRIFISVHLATLSPSAAPINSWYIKRSAHYLGPPDGRGRGCGRRRERRAPSLPVSNFRRGEAQKISPCCESHNISALHESSKIVVKLYVVKYIL